MNFADTLQPFNVATLPSLDAGAGAVCTDAAASLAEDYRLVRQVQRRSMIDATRVANATQLLKQLPDPEEDVHLILRGNCDWGDMTSAIIELAGATCEEAIFTTLGTNERHTKRLIDLIDTGRILSCWFLVSVYFQSADRDVFDYLAEQLTIRGHRVAARRNHAKLQLFRFTDGRCIVAESSANLRACRNCEQALVTQSPALFEFHKGWISELFAKEGQK